MYDCASLRPRLSAKVKFLSPRRKAFNKKRVFVIDVPYTRSVIQYTSVRRALKTRRAYMCISHHHAHTYMRKSRMCRSLAAYTCVMVDGGLPSVRPGMTREGSASGISVVAIINNDTFRSHRSYLLLIISSISGCSL